MAEKTAAVKVRLASGDVGWSKALGASGSGQGVEDAYAEAHKHTHYRGWRL